jgi:hypothetical protein
MGKYEARKENFIQKIAITKNISPSEARKFYREVYEPESDINRRKIMKQVNKKMRDISPPTTPHPSARDDKRSFKPPKIKKTKSEKTKKTKKRKIISGGRQYTSDTYNRVKRAKKKYPYASNYELRHGVNSIASQEYRQRQKNKRSKNK